MREREREEEEKRKRVQERGGSEGVHESYAQCGCTARDSENLWPLPADIYGAGGCIPGLTHFFVEYYLCTPSGCKYSCGTRAHLPCIALLAAANRNKCSSRNLKFQRARCALVVYGSQRCRIAAQTSVGILFLSSMVLRYLRFSPFQSGKCGWHCRFLSLQQHFCDGAKKKT